MKCSNRAGIDMNDNQKISKINQLNDQIRDVEYAINVFRPEANITRGSGSKDINGIIKIERKTRLSIFGSRWFGVGTHKTEIELPSTMVEDIQKLMVDRRDKLRSELDGLLHKA